MISIIVGIILSVIAAAIYDLLKSSIKWLPGVLKQKNRNFNTLPSDDQTVADQNVDDFRAKNRANFNVRIFNIIFYSITFYLLYICHSLPIQFVGGMFNKTKVYIDQARFIGEFMPHILVTNDYFQFPFIVSTVVMYLPTLYLTNLIGTPVILLMSQYYKPSIYMWRRIQIFVFSLFALPQAGLMIYCFYNKSLKESIGIPFILAIIILVIALSNQEKR